MTEAKAKPKEKQTQRVTSEKPISLNKLSFKDALFELMAVKPPPKEAEKKEKKKADSHRIGFLLKRNRPGATGRERRGGGERVRLTVY